LPAATGLADHRAMFPARSMQGLCGCVLALATFAALAADVGQHEARRLRDTGTIMSLEAIMEAALALNPGRVLDTELEHEDGRYIYELEVLDAGGNVYELELDAATGELLEREMEH
jgi:uncharacterized membrane protein YkoI